MVVIGFVQSGPTGGMCFFLGKPIDILVEVYTGMYTEANPDGHSPLVVGLIPSSGQAMGPEEARALFKGFPLAAKLAVALEQAGKTKRKVFYLGSIQSTPKPRAKSA